MVNVLIGRFDMSIEVVALPPLTPLAPAPLSVRTSDFDEVHPRLSRRIHRSSLS